MTTATAPELYYDPYDFEIDRDPYPTWKRMRDEAPLYYNEKHDFFALSRFDDVDRCFTDVETYISGKGTVLEMIRSGFPVPPGLLLFDDNPIHDVYREVLSRAFRAKHIAALEEQIRQFCAAALDPKVGTGSFDFIADLGAQMPMKTIGMLLGIPEQDQAAIREEIDAGLALAEDGQANYGGGTGDRNQEMFGAYVDYRTEHPSDDIMTELIQADLNLPDGTTRKLTREELLNYIGMLAAAGNETTTRPIGWTGKLLAEHPDQLAAVSADRSLIPRAIEEILRYESPSPVQSRYITKDVEWYGQTIAAGNAMVLLNGSANRDERHFENADQFDIHRRIDRHLAFGYGIHFCLGGNLARLEGRIALDEVLKRFPNGWEVDYDASKQAHTSTVRGWDKLVVRTA
ncbi:MAG TPA: cytochrome P450 [Mycobacteriales bacterium]|nr:cytochrome P450 [Mycobacteriales bacterium]